jgi:DNA-binding transcriptional regulator YdaS (Cro superfamily)
MTEAPMQDLRDHFAHCVQVFGGVTPASRRLGIDERAIRRFVSGELPVSARLMEDVRSALRGLVAEATTAEQQISAAI